ncbi:MAG: NADH:flavin oxidoreductase/NADH oxidase family protein [Deltaproteobacteria bacterium]|nr:NADH:flavin oxidoreductase/NADH oxidase family protein [Deltaproteobacteria bacterium]
MDIREALDRPLALPCGASLPNRFGKSAMSEALGDRANLPSDRLLRLYGRWANAGAGLLISGNVLIDRRGLEHADNVVIDRDDIDVEPFRRWADVAQAGGAKLWMQINHAGRQAMRVRGQKPLSPSDVPVKGMGPLFAAPKPLTEDEILGLVQAYARAARVAKQAGFAGVQIHGAHGYLVNQFLSPYVNRRTDRWGGSLENRARFVLEIVAAMRREVGPDYPVGIKLNSADFQRGGFSEDESMDVVAMLDEAGLDLLEISGGNYEAPAMVGAARKSTVEREAYFLDYAEKVRARTKLPLMVTGGFRSAEAMVRAIEGGAVDVIGLARPMAVTPELPRLLLEGAMDRAVMVPDRVGIRDLDNLLQIFCYGQQLRRMGDGLEPRVARSPWAALGQGMRELLAAQWRVLRQPSIAAEPHTAENA